MSMMSEFRDFAMRGNVVDMAVGIVIGGAFGKIVSSFVIQPVRPTRPLKTAQASRDGLNFIFKAL